MAPRLLEQGVEALTERPGALRRTVLVACPGSTRSYLDVSARDPAPVLYMKAITEDPRTTEPVGIVISRGSKAEPAPIFLAFVWGAAPELSPVPRDTKAA